MSTVTFSIPEMIFVGCTLMAFWLLQENQPEISAAVFGLAFAMNELAVWFTPIYWTLVIYMVIGRHLQVIMELVNTQLSAVNQYFTTLT